MTLASDAQRRAAAGDRVMVDLRERGSYARGHLPGAVSLPRRLLEERLALMVTARGTPLLVCDEDEGLCHLALPTIRAMGYRNVEVLDGGLRAWRDSGRRLVEGVNVGAKAFAEQLVRTGSIPVVGPEVLAEWLARGDAVDLVDVRPAGEYASGHLPGACNLPTGELVQLLVHGGSPAEWQGLQAGQQDSPADRALVLHCGGRTRALVATASIRALGLAERVFALDNGTMGWLLAGHKLEGGGEAADTVGVAWSPTEPGGAAERLAASAGAARLDVSGLRQLWDRRGSANVCLIDVRSDTEYRSGHLPGAAWVPAVQVVQEVDDHVVHPEISVILYCDDGIRSWWAAGWLQRMGYRAVSVLDGGLAAWQQAGGQFESGPERLEVFGLAEARQLVPQIAPGPGCLAGAAIVCLDGHDVYETGHVRDALWLCRSRLEWRIGEAVPDRSTPVVLASRAEPQSWLGARRLVELGYGRVRVLAGSPETWLAAGIEWETGPTHLADEPDDVVAKPHDEGPEAMLRYLRWEEALEPSGSSSVSLWVDGPRPSLGLQNRRDR